MRRWPWALRGAWVSLSALALLAPTRAQQGPASGPPEAQAPQVPAAPVAVPTASTNAADASSVPAKSTQIEVPTGTHLPLVLHNGISTRSARAGDPVYFETVFPVTVNGQVVIPAGTYVSGEVTESKRPGRVKGRGEIMIRLTSMILPNAYIVDLNAAPNSASSGGRETVNSEGKIVGGSSKGRDAGTVIGTTITGTEVGTAVGAASGNIGRGAAIGAGAGALAGLGAVLLTRGPEAELPRGSTIEAVTERPIYLDAEKAQFTTPGQAPAVAGPPNREGREYRRSLPTPF